MSMAAPMMGTVTLKGPTALNAPTLRPVWQQAAIMAAAAAISTTAPAPSAVTRYEDTALRASFHPAKSVRAVEREESAAVARINELAAYDAGWNGPDSVGPTVETVRQAIEFVRQLCSLGKIAQPLVNLASDGEINFYWQTEAGLTMDLGFTGTSWYSYFAETREGKEFIEDGAEIGQPLPAVLIAALRA